MKYLTRGVVFYLAVTLLTACGGSSDSDEVQLPQAHLRIINAVPDAPVMTFSLGEEVGAVSGIDYAAGSGLASVDADSYVGIFSGNLPDEGNTDLTDPLDLVLAEDVHYEVVLLGDYASLETQVYEEPVDFDSTLGRIKIAHFGKALPPVEIHVSGASEPIGASVVVESLEYKEAIAATTLDAGTYRVRITPVASDEVIYDSGEITLNAGSDLFMGVMDNAWIVNASDAQSPIVLSIFSGGGQSVLFDKDRAAYVRTVHVSADAPALDVFIDDNFASPIAENLSYGDYTSLHSTLPKAQLDLLVSETGNTTPLVDKIIDLRDGGSYTMLLFGLLADEGIEPAFMSDSPRSIASQASYRLVNLLTGDAELDMYVVATGASIAEETPVVDEFESPSYSQYYASAAGDFDLVVTETGSETPLMAPIPLNFALGENYTIIVRDGVNLTAPTATTITD